MNTKKIKILEPLGSETLSSWMWRVNSASPIPLITYMRFTSSECEIKAQDWRGLHGENFEDRDLLSQNPFIGPFQEKLGIPQAWLKKRFPVFRYPSIPAQFRRAFCSQCFSESFQAVGIPVSKMQWCYLTQPFCDVHNVLLHDSLDYFINHDDYAVQAFVSYWDIRMFKENCDLISDAWPLRFGLALRTQKRLLNIARKVADPCDAFKVHMFMLTLMRAVMMPALHYAYPGMAFSNWGGPEAYHGRRNYINFFQEVYRSSCVVRAHALYLSAIVLGWATKKEAFETLSENYYTPWTSESVWSSLEEIPGLVSLIVSELKVYETQYLNLASLEMPSLMRWMYGA